MRKLGWFALVLGVSSVVACNAPAQGEASGSSESGLVSDVASMSQNPDGTFEVTCKDGRLEHSVTSDAIRSDQVCVSRHPALRCGVLYYFSSPSDPIPQVSAGSLDESFDVFPNV